MTDIKNKPGVQFGIHRIYVKDVSFEAPEAPATFRQPWKPKVNLELETRSHKLEDGVYEVILEITATVKNEDKVGFIVEVEQAGIFTIKGMADDVRQRTIGAYCPNILFSYARETIDGLAVKGSFPALMISPVNFDQLYEQSLEKRQQKDAKKA